MASKSGRILLTIKRSCFPTDRTDANSAAAVARQPSSHHGRLRTARLVLVLALAFRPRFAAALASAAARSARMYCKSAVDSCLPLSIKRSCLRCSLWASIANLRCTSANSFWQAAIKARA